MAQWLLFSWALFLADDWPTSLGKLFGSWKHARPIRSDVHGHGHVPPGHKLLISLPI